MCRELTLCYTVAMLDRLLARTLLSAVALLVTLAGCALIDELRALPVQGLGISVLRSGDAGQEAGARLAFRGSVAPAAAR